MGGLNQTNVPRGVKSNYAETVADDRKNFVLPLQYKVEGGRNK